jgi:hypothetical protein
MSVMVRGLETPSGCLEISEYFGERGRLEPVKCGITAEPGELTAGILTGVTFNFFNGLFKGGLVFEVGEKLFVTYCF